MMRGGWELGGGEKVFSLLGLAAAAEREEKRRLYALNISQRSNLKGGVLLPYTDAAARPKRGLRRKRAITEKPRREDLSFFSIFGKGRGAFDCEKKG